MAQDATTDNLTARADILAQTIRTISRDFDEGKITGKRAYYDLGYVLDEFFKEPFPNRIEGIPFANNLEGHLEAQSATGADALSIQDITELRETALLATIRDTYESAKNGPSYLSELSGAESFLKSYRGGAHGLTLLAEDSGPSMVQRRYAPYSEALGQILGTNEEEYTQTIIADYTEMFKHEVTFIEDAGVKTIENMEDLISEISQLKYPDSTQLEAQRLVLADMGYDEVDMDVWKEDAEARSAAREAKAISDVNSSIAKTLEHDYRCSELRDTANNAWRLDANLTDIERDMHRSLWPFSKEGTYNLSSPLSKEFAPKGLDIRGLEAIEARVELLRANQEANSLVSAYRSVVGYPGCKGVDEWNPDSAQKEQEFEPQYLLGNEYSKWGLRTREHWTGVTSVEVITPLNSEAGGFANGLDAF